MNIIHHRRKFPKISETFILNQMVGLIDKSHRLQIFAEKAPEAPAEHDLIQEHDILDRTVYSQRSSTYTEGMKRLTKIIPDLIRMGYSPHSLAHQFRYGGNALYRLENARDMYIRAGEADVLHSHFGTDGKSCLPAQQLTQLPLVVSFYGFDVSEVPQSNPSAYEELFERAAMITCLSKDMKADIVDLGGPIKKIRKVPLCIETDVFEYKERDLASDEPIRILTVARHVEKKGLEYAIEAVAQLDIERPVTYSIAGDGPRRESLENQVAKLDASDRVEMLGWQTQNEVAQLMADAHVFLLPSVTGTDGNKEGTPTVLLEAQAAGLPVVSTTHAGIPEIVNDGNAGLLVPERDVNSLVNALEEMLSHPEQWEDMGRAGREYVETHHSIESVTEELVAVYKSAAQI